MDDLSSSPGSSDQDDLFVPRGVQPYLYEPLAREDGVQVCETGMEATGDNGSARLGHINWCTCSACVAMPTSVESVCCSEIPEVAAKTDAHNCRHNAQLQCITEHPGFQSVCLDRWVLETAHYQYMQQYGGLARQDPSENEKLRHTAYRQLVRWCWQFLGRRVRVPLPSCAVTKIRQTFPSSQQTGFQEM
ncbi:P2X purinoceptor 7-like [Engraulis encrasicolus]|uniref:P2X purinoceptor 7-like n=1 Tax=Engraulis encrasicolus TaxID=184585 RepID=UPI002FD68604